MEGTTPPPEKKSPMAKGRSRAYPTVGLKSMVDFCERICEVHAYGEFTRLEFANSQGLKQPSGSMNSSFSACVQYGLIEIVREKSKLTELARKILNPEDEAEREAAIKEAFARPELHKELIAKYGGNKLPKALGNVLLATFGIHASVKDTCANLFLSSARFAKMIDNEGVLSPNTDMQESFTALDSLPVPTQVRHQGMASRSPIPLHAQQHGTGLRHDIALPNGRRALLLLPDDFGSSDMKVITAFVTFLKTQVGVSESEQNVDPALPDDQVE